MGSRIIVGTQPKHIEIKQIPFILNSLQFMFMKTSGQEFVLVSANTTFLKSVVTKENFI